MPTLSRVLVAPSVACVVGVLVACGGASPDEFREQANKICVDGERALGGLEAPSSPEQAEQFFDRADSQLQEAKRRFEGLELPGGEEGEQAERYVERFGQQSERASGALDRLRAALDSRDPQRIQQAGAQIQQIGEDQELDRLARQLKLEQCAS